MTDSKKIEWANMIVCMELLANDRQHTLDELSLSSGVLNSFNVDALAQQSATAGKYSPGEPAQATSLNEVTILDGGTPIARLDAFTTSTVEAVSAIDSASSSPLQSIFGDAVASETQESAVFAGDFSGLTEQESSSFGADSLLDPSEASSIERFDAALDEGFSRLDQSLYGEFRDFTYDVYNGIEDGLKALGGEIGDYANDAGVPLVKPVVDQLNSVDYVDTISAGPASVTSFARSAIGDVNDLRSELLVG